MLRLDNHASDWAGVSRLVPRLSAALALAGGRGREPMSIAFFDGSELVTFVNSLAIRFDGH
jgi:hypothetical protein